MDKNILNERFLGLSGIIPMNKSGFIRNYDLPSCDLSGIYKKESS